MSNITSHINTPVTGMNTDLLGLNISNKEYTYALNAGISDFTGEEYNLKNTHSNYLKTNIPDGYVIIGHKNIVEKDTVLLFLVNPKTNESQIGEVKKLSFFDKTDEEYNCVNGDCSETYNKENTPLEKIKQIEYSSFLLIKSDPCLNFNIDYPVDIEYRITDCGINIYFTDYYNQRRYLYLEYENGNLKIKQEFYEIIGYDVNNCNVPIYGTNLDCNKLLYNPCFSKPCISFVDVTNLGTLKAGTYQFLMCYSDKFGNPLTNYFPACNNIPIFEKKTTTVTNYPTNNSLTISINNIENQTFLYYNLVVVETIDNFTEFKLVGTFETSFKDVQTYTYTGSNTLQKLTATDIFFRRPYYSKAKSVTKSNNYLFFSNLEEYKQLNLQRVANDIKLHWQTIAIPETVYDKPENFYKYRTYQRDEVYAFAIIFEFCDGWESCAFHIPGNSVDYYIDNYSLNPLDIIPSSNLDVIDDTSCANIDLNKRFQVYNTAQKIPSLCEYKVTENCETPLCWEAGDFGYYESTDTYPNIPKVWGSLCGQPIRFHRMPDSCVTHIHDSQCGSKKFNENNVIFPIGIRVDHNSVITSLLSAVSNDIITQEDYNKIVGYRIVRANRSGNKSIVAKGLLYDMNSYVKDNKIYHYANYPYNDLSPDYFISPTKDTYNQDSLKNLSLPNSKPPITQPFVYSSRWTFHSPDTHFVNPTLGSILKLETVEYGETEGFFNICDEEPKYKRLTFFSRLIALGMGIAAALSSTEEKDCVTYTIKSNYKIKEVPLKTNYNLKQDLVYSNISGAFTSITTTQGNANDKDITGDIETEERINVQDNSVCLGFGEHSKKDGTKQTTSQNKIIQGAISDIKGCEEDGLDNDNVVEQYQKTTCTGTPHQLLSLTQTDNVIMQGLNVVLQGLLGGTPPQTVQQVLIGMREMDIVNNLIRSLIPEKNYTIQYNSVGHYNNYVCVPDTLGIKQRKILKSAYLSPMVQSISDSLTTSSFSTVTVNNWRRESSVYIHADASGSKSFLQPHSINPLCVPADNSRVTMGEKGMNFSYDDLGKRFNRNIASYYASIKNPIINQYGNLSNIEYLETNSCTFNLNEVQEANLYTVFGGDTFINKFSLKRKVPFFIQSRFKLPNGSDVSYSELGNIGFPNYYFDTEKALFDRISTGNVFTSLLNPATLLDEIVGLEEARLDVKTTRKDPTNIFNSITTPSLFWQRGYIYLYSYGIPTFFVESDINVDFRHGENNLEKDFYPNNTNLEEWLQEKNVSIREDNYYFYNKTYSRQNKESFICTSNSNVEYDKSCKVIHPNRIIYSDNQDFSVNDFDTWRIFKANSFFDLPLSDGKIISADGIESDKVLVRSENMARIFNAYNLIPTDQENIQVETGGIFKSRPQEFSVTDLGYAGSQHSDIIHTEYGHIWVDAKRGNIFNLGAGASGLDELTKYKMKNWFKENLPFYILKQFPNVDVNNQYKGLGISLCFDRRFNRMFITKRDYKPLSPSIKYDETNKKFYIENNVEKIYVELTDTRYFCDKSWTISFDFFTKSWVSFHSFKPLFYINYLEYFDSVINGSIWSHNVSNKSYQVYYSKLYPFIIEYLTEPSISNNDINSLEFSLDAVRFHNDYDYFYNKLITFNKAIVYNERQCSGLLELIPKNENNLSQLLDYPKHLKDRSQILITNSENIWKFNNFYNIVNSEINNTPIFINNCANDYKELNPKSLNYYNSLLNSSRIKSKQCKVRLINDIHSNYLFIFNFAQTNQNKSYR